MVTSSDYDNLDAKALEILEAIYESGGEADTSEIKEYTGIEKNGIVHYRYEKLADSGLITTRTGDPDGSKIPPTVATLTDEAQEEIEGGLFGEESATIIERMDRIERQYRATHEALRDVQNDFEMWRFDPETDEEIDATELRDRVDEIEQMGDELREQLEAFRSFESDQYDTNDLVEAVHRLESRLGGIDNEQAEIHREMDQLAYLLATVEKDDIEGNWEQDIWGHLQDEQNRLDQMESAIGEAKEQASRAAKKASSGQSGIQSDIQRQSQRIDVLEEQLQNRDESVPSGSFWNRLKWLFTGSA